MDWNNSRGTATSATLVDIVSKNGNLLLNVVLHPDGSLPPEMEKFLSEMADWMQINGEAIFGTRPWTVFGEGAASAIRQGAFNDNVPFTEKDTARATDITGTDIFAGNSLTLAPNNVVPEPSICASMLASLALLIGFQALRRRTA